LKRDKLRHFKSTKGGNTLPTLRKPASGQRVSEHFVPLFIQGERISPTLGQRLIALWQLLQSRDTTFGQIIELSGECGIDGRQVLADHIYRQPDLSLASLEA
jgi:hypothetical protein